MEKKPRKKKALDVQIDTKVIDVNVVRTETGEVDVTIDTPIVDAHYHKDATGGSKLEIDMNGTYKFESNGSSLHMPKGSVWMITGEMLKNFLEKKLGKHIK
jgi:hypothetical protein